MKIIKLLLVPIFLVSFSNFALAQIAVPGASLDKARQINDSDVQINVPDNIYSEAFNLARNNDSISSIEIDGDWTHVSYKHKTKFLWFIPVNVTLKASANLQEKKLQIGRPWWSLFTSTPTSSIKAAMQESFDKLSFGSDQTKNKIKVMKVMASVISQTAPGN
ncbi:MAG: hypothetical protein U9M89_02160 [Patescibacteria group bacterium]|nr:hypothetical protein [Patescibacteria group bacterium]